MRTELIRKHLQNTRAGIDQAISLLDSRESNGLSSPASTDGRVTAAANATEVREALDETRRHCIRAFDALVAQQEEPTDADAVREQLLEVAPVAIRHFAESHPFGSTVEIEQVADVELENETVQIPVETDNLPYWLDGTWTRDGVEVELEFRLVRVDWHPPVNMQSSGTEFAVYAVDIV